MCPFSFSGYASSLHQPDADRGEDRSRLQGLSLEACRRTDTIYSIEACRFMRLHTVSKHVDVHAWSVWWHYGLECVVALWIGVQVGRDVLISFEKEVQRLEDLKQSKVHCPTATLHSLGRACPWLQRAWAEMALYSTSLQPPNGAGRYDGFGLKSFSFFGG